LVVSNAREEPLIADFFAAWIGVLDNGVLKLEVEYCCVWEEAIVEDEDVS
jgi:hypothetical protein